jgi:hypothetical protein
MITAGSVRCADGHLRQYWKGCTALGLRRGRASFVAVFRLSILIFAPG